MPRPLFFMGCPAQRTKKNGVTFGLYCLLAWHSHANHFNVTGAFAHFAHSHKIAKNAKKSVLPKAAVLFCLVFFSLFLDILPVRKFGQAGAHSAERKRNRGPVCWGGREKKLARKNRNKDADNDVFFCIRPLWCESESRRLAFWMSQPNKGKKRKRWHTT